MSFLAKIGNFGCIKTYVVLSQPKLWDMNGRGARSFSGKTCDLERTVTFIHFEVDDQVNYDAFIQFEGRRPSRSDAAVT